MGEIRVKVILANSHDDTKFRAGELPRSGIRIYEADAMVDTGAVRSVIPAHVLEKLGVGIRGTRGISEGIIFDLQGRDTLDEALISGDEIRIGSTVVNKLDMQIDCANRRLLPNPAHPDQPVSKVK